MNKQHINTMSYYSTLFQKYNVDDVFLSDRVKKRAVGSVLEQIDKKGVNLHESLDKARAKKLRKAFSNEIWFKNLAASLTFATAVTLFQAPPLQAKTTLPLISKTQSSFATALIDEDSSKQALEKTSEEQQKLTSLHFITNKPIFNDYMPHQTHTALLDDDSDVAHMPQNKTTSLTVIDTSINDWKIIASNVTEGAVLLLKKEDNPLDAMIGELKKLGSVESLNIISHGSNAELHFGNETITKESLETNKAKWQELGSYLSQDGDIKLLGCNVAQGEEGKAFVNELAEITKADVAASIDATGSTKLGGNWDLEWSNGEVEKLTALSIEGMQGLREVLACTVSTDATTHNGYPGFFIVDGSDNNIGIMYVDDVFHANSYYRTSGLFNDGGSVTDTLAHFIEYSPDICADADTTAPTLSGATSSNIAQTTATVSATSDENATMYYVIATSSSTPTAANVIGNTVTNSVKSANAQAIAATQKDFSVTGLTAGTQYYVYFVAKDSADNNSTVSSANFTTVSSNVDTNISGTLLTTNKFDRPKTIADDDVGVNDTVSFTPTYYPNGGGVTGLWGGENQYFTRNVIPSASGTFTFTVTAAAFNDTFLALYDTSFDPANPLTNLILVQDDGYGSSTLWSRFNHSLISGHTYVLVLTSFDSLSTGALTVTVTGPSAVAVSANAYSSDVQASDTTPPTFDITPTTSNVASTTLDLNTSLDENGTIYYIVVENNATAPTSAQVKAGVNYGSVTKVASANSATIGAGFDGNFTISGLTASTAYDIYVTAQDDASTPNLQTSVVKVDVTTVTTTTSPSLINGLGGTSSFGEIDYVRADDPYYESSTDNSWDVNQVYTLSELQKGNIDLTPIFGAQGAKFGNSYFTTAYINNNGALSFGHTTSSFDATGLQNGVLANPESLNYADTLVPALALFWTDLNTIYNTDITTSGGTSTGTNLVHLDVDSVNKKIIITWDDVAEHQHSGTAVLAGQMILTAVGSNGDMDVQYRYEYTSSLAQRTVSAGWNVGVTGGTSGIDYYEIPLNPASPTPGSTNYTALSDLDTRVGNTGEVGIWEFSFRNGGIADKTPPTFDITPTASNIAGTTLDLNTSLDENGTVYYIVVPNNATSPTSAQVKAGVNYGSVTKITSASIATTGAGFDGNFTISGLSASIAYDIYVTAQDDESTPNLMADGNVSKVDVTTLAQANQAPIWSIDNNTTNEDNNLDINLSNFISDVDSNSFTFNAESNNTNLATISIINGILTVTPVSNASGVVGITLWAYDGDNNISKDINITIASINDTPTINTTFNNISMQEDNGTTSYELNVSDIDGNDLNVTVESNDTALMSVTPNWTNLINQATYSQPLDFNLTTVANANGIARITIKVNDTESNTTQSFDVNVTAVNDAPTLTAIATQSKNEDFISYVIELNGTDIDSTNLIYTAFSNNTNLVNVSVLDNNLTLTPVANAHGDTTIDVNVTDGNLTQSISFDINITATNDAPTWSLENNATNEEQNLDINLSNFISDVDSNSFTFNAESNNTNLATLTIINGVLTVTPIANANGTVNITVYAHDGDNNISKDINITIASINDTPTINTTFSNISMQEDNGTTSYELNVSDIDGNDLNITVESNNTALMSVAPNWTNLVNQATWSQPLDFNLSTQANMNGIVRIKITAQDNDLNTTQSFDVNISNVNDAPTSTNISFTIDEDTNKTFALNDFNFTDIDTNDSVESIIITSLPNKGTLKLSDVNVTLSQTIPTSNIGNLVYTPLANENGIPYTTFGFKVNDGEANSSSEYTVTLNVSAVDDAPLLNSITNISGINEDGTINDINIIASDIDGNISYNITTSNNSLVTVSIVDGKIRIVPVENQSGNATITLVATANNVDVNTTFDINITSVNDAPQLNSGYVLTIPDENSYAQINDNAELRVQQHTISMWVKPNSVLDKWQPLLMKTDSEATPNQRNYSLWTVSGSLNVHYAVTINGVNKT